METGKKSLKRKVTIIDDYEHCREALGIYLRQKGYEVVCLSAPTCCQLYSDPKTKCSKEKVSYHFLLTDNRMPGIKGLDLISLQKCGGCKRPACMKAVLSGSWNSDELARARELGCKVFHKPYKLDEIADWLEQQENSFFTPDKGF
jgi:CheY-like chemotaxis protein